MKTFKAAYTQSYATDTCVVTAALANTTTDAPTGTVKLCTAGPEGSLVTKVTALPRATITAARLDLYVSRDGGTTKRLVGSVLMAGRTVDATSANAAADFGITAEAPLVLGPGEELYAGSAVASAGGIVFRAQREDY